MRKLSALEQANATYLSEQDIEFSFLLPTETGLHKSIMDAISPLREYFLQKEIHDYSCQAQGQSHKVCLDAQIAGLGGVVKSKASLYRPETKRGDPRIWFSGLKSQISANEILAIVAVNGMLYALNLSAFDFQEQEAVGSEFSTLLSELRPSKAIHETARELLNKLNAIARNGFIPAECAGSTAIGRTLESALGLKMNSSPLPDYKGIEIKSKRRKSKTKHSLFSKVPEWDLGTMGSTLEFLNAYGYHRDGLRRLNCTVNALKRNPQGLQLVVEYGLDLLLESGMKDGNLDPRVLVWPLPVLRQKLATKHKETFWVTAETRIKNGQEEFLFNRVEYTRAPRVHQFSDLLSAGLVIIDHEIKEVGASAKEHGPSFKASKAGHKLLFPSSSVFELG